MKIRISLITVFALFIALVGCESKKDTLKFIIEDTGIPNTQSASYEVNIGNKVGRASVVAELWQNGEHTESTPLTLDKDTKRMQIYTLVDGFGTEEGAKGLNIQMETDEISGSVLTYFELPQEIVGYSFTAYEDMEVININADEEIILAAMAFDTGSGVRSVDCKSLISEPDKLKSYSCVMVIRASFTAEQINTSDG